MLRPVRVLYKEMLAGDRLKVEARSNRSPTGGGARDFRFNHDAFGPIFATMFPGRDMEERLRDGQRREIEVYVGRLRWYGDPDRPETVTETRILYEPPTDSRDTEGRIATVHKYEPFRRYPAAAEGLVLLLLIEDASGAVWPQYTTEASLRSGGWNRHIAPRLLQCIDETPASKTVLGWIDLTTPSHYCHGARRPRSAR